MNRRSALRVTTSNLELLQCPICYEIPAGNVFQCVNGHTICSTCISRVRECPFCKVSFWTEPPGGGARKRIRALGIESMLDAMTFECPNKKLGCQVILKRGTIRHHLKNDCIHEPPENIRTPSDNEQEIGNQFDADLLNIRADMQQDFLGHVQGRRNIDWERICGAAIFFITGLCFIGLLIASLAVDHEVKWSIISIRGRRFTLRL